MECAFWHLKVCWCGLSREMDLHIENVHNVITACYVLQSICEVHQDSFDDVWPQKVEPPRTLVKLHHRSMVYCLVPLF